MLEQSGYAVDCASDGAEAVSLVRASRYDLILMDMQMPGMDGATATRRIRAMADQMRHVPIIAMTANVLSGDLRRCREAGMDDHIGKPFERSALRAKVEHWLARPNEFAARPGMGNEGSILDADAQDELREVLGAAKFDELLRGLELELERRFLAPDLEKQGVAEAFVSSIALDDAHVIAGCAGTLGFRELSQACRALMAAKRERGEWGPELRRCLKAKADALVKLSELRNATRSRAFSRQADLTGVFS
jgi:CheY-like chemotaxis protein/HPt (histidine-containing phosphotransfer) domain-containing protein